MEKLVNTLEKCGYRVEVFRKSKEAKEALLREISVEDSIGIGGSMTILDMEVYKELKDRGNEVYWHWKAEDKANAQIKARNAKTYISSVNAITKDGKIINVDATGNRVASLIFGHEDVYIVAGKNKICEDYHSAIERIRNVAAPKNAIRLKLKTPCTRTGKCMDCNSQDRICNVETIISRNPNGTKIHIYLVDEELGY